MAVSVLVLDPDPSMRDLIRIILAKDGIETRFCGSPSEVVRIAGEAPFPLLIAGFWGTSHWVLATDEREQIIEVASAVPTILITSRYWATPRTVAGLGLAALVGKPFDIDELRALVAARIAQVGSPSSDCP
jgi:DNA-binding response OmpR family regulator